MSVYTSPRVNNPPTTGGVFTRLPLGPKSGRVRKHANQVKINPAALLLAVFYQEPMLRPPFYPSSGRRVAHGTTTPSTARTVGAWYPGTDDENFAQFRAFSSGARPTPLRLTRVLAFRDAIFDNNRFFFSLPYIY